MDVKKKRQLAACKLGTFDFLLCFFGCIFFPVLCSVRYRKQLVIGAERPSKPLLRK